MVSKNFDVLRPDQLLRCGVGQSSGLRLKSAPPRLSPAQHWPEGHRQQGRKLGCIVETRTGLASQPRLATGFCFSVLFIRAHMSMTIRLAVPEDAAAACNVLR